MNKFLLVRNSVGESTFTLFCDKSRIFTYFSPIFFATQELARMRTFYIEVIKNLHNIFLYDVDKCRKNLRVTRSV